MMLIVPVAALMIVFALPASAQERWSWPERAENLQQLPADFPGQQLRAVMGGISANEWHTSADAILTGFMPSLEVVDATATPEDVLVHDESNPLLARLLIDLHLPVALGVIYRKPAQSFEDAFYSNHPSRMQRTRRVRDLLAGPASWTVE